MFSEATLKRDRSSKPPQGLVRQLMLDSKEMLKTQSSTRVRDPEIHSTGTWKLTWALYKYICILYTSGQKEHLLGLWPRRRAAVTIDGHKHSLAVRSFGGWGKVQS